MRPLTRKRHDGKLESFCCNNLLSRSQFCAAERFRGLLQVMNALEICWFVLIDFHATSTTVEQRHLAATVRTVVLGKETDHGAFHAGMVNLHQLG